MVLYAACLVCLFISAVQSQQFRPNPRMRFNRRLDNDVQEFSSNDISCPERYGRFAHQSQCDAYVECEEGVAAEKLCPDGLLFNSKARYFSYPCQYPVDVDCTGREQKQSAQPTDECPHKYGFFKLGDQNNCGQFLNCVDGRAYKFDCPYGLAFDEATIRCDWPDQVPSCNAEAYVGFTCPASEGLFGPEEYQTYKSPSDCQKYFVCINGKPRVYVCPEGQGFNEETRSCDDADNVPACIFGEVHEPPPLPPTKT